MAVLLLCSCADSDNEVLVDACVKAGQTNNAQADDAVLNARCNCAADTARKYLDPDNYKLLVKVAVIYNENQPDDVKVHDMINGFVGAGMSLTQSAGAAMDMMFLAHKVDRECGYRTTPNT